MYKLPSNDGLKVVTMPAFYRPRDYQKAVWDYMIEKDGKNAVLIWPRRHGKDMTALNIMAYKALFHRVGTYFYILPEATQGVKVVWDGIDGQGQRFIDAFPEEVIFSKRNDIKQLTLIHPDCLKSGYMGKKKPGSVFQIIGADADRLVGTNPVGVVLSEYPLFPANFINFLTPILVENDGWQLFTYTPRGMNHGYDIYAKNKNNPKWHVELQTIETMIHNGKQVVTRDQIEELVSSGLIEEELVEQEFFCSFDINMAGSYYGKVLTYMADNGHITNVPYEPYYPVFTAWDLGHNDTMVCLYFQYIRGEVRLIDYMEDSGEELAYYLQKMREKPYQYEMHYFPHDISAHHYASGVSGADVLKRHGIRNYRRIPRAKNTAEVLDGIQAVRAMLKQTWIDSGKCDIPLKALKEYRKEASKIRTHENKVIYKDTPYHGWESNICDAFRTFAVALKIHKGRGTMGRRNVQKRIKYGGPFSNRY